MVHAETDEGARKKCVMSDPQLHRPQEPWWLLASLAGASGVLLGVSFPPSPFYSLAYVAFIPLFFLFSKLETYSRTAGYSYIFLFIFHLITV